MSLLLQVRDLRFGYGGEPVLDGVSFAVHAGECVGILGPNGAGKSTLLKLALGLLVPASGEVLLGGTPLAALPRRARALRAAFLPQAASMAFPFEAAEVVAMGRTPHLGRFRPEGPADRAAVARAMERTGLGPLAGRPVTELSGGERQRVFLARALAQEAPLLVMDEPTASLDLRHAFELLTLARAQALGGGGVLAALHDLNLAARFCDRLLVLHGGRLEADGAPSLVLAPDLLRRVFGVEALIGSDPGTGRPVVHVVGPA